MSYITEETAPPERSESLSIDGERSKYVGLLAGVIIAVAGQPMLSSIVVMSDMPALFWAMLAAWLTIRATEPDLSLRARGGWFLAAGAALGMAIITRWIYGLIAPALILYTLLQLRGAGWPALAAVLSGTLMLAPQLWLRSLAPQETHHFIANWQVSHFFQREFHTAEGFLTYAMPPALFYLQPLGHPAYLAPLIGITAGWGVWRLWQRRNYAMLALLLGWFIPIYLLLAGLYNQNFRYGLALYPPLVLLSSLGAVDLLTHAARVRFGRPLAQGAIALSLIGMLLWAYPMLDGFVSAQQQDKSIAAQVAAATEADATIVSFGLTLTLQHYTERDIHELYYLDGAGLVKLADSHTPFYLLLNLNNLNQQWRDELPQRSYQTLAAETTLIEVGRFPPYTLLRVEAKESRR